MLISHTHRFVYTKTVKTASTSVELFLQPLATGDGPAAAEQTETVETEHGIVGYRGGDPAGRTWFNHMSLQAIADLMDPAAFSSYFKFCCVRNPFDKLVSAFYFFERPDTAAAAAEQIAAFGRWLDRDRLLSDWRTASVFDRDKYVLRGGEVGVDFFVRYESLRADLARVLERLGVPAPPGDLPRLKTTSRSSIPTAAFYGDREIAKVEDWYAFELERFGYRLSRAKPC